MSFFKCLLYLYPSSFRNDYGPELLHIVAKRRNTVSGFLPSLLFWVAQILDTFRNAALMHFDIFARDFRYSLRAVIRAPGFAVTAVLVTALGVGANTAVFSIVNHVLIRPLPYPHASRLVQVWEKQREYSRTEVSPPNYRDWQEMNRTFESMGVYANISRNLVGIREPEHVKGAAVTASLFPMLAINPLVGRAFTDHDDLSGAPGTILLSYGFWQTRFGGSLEALRRPIRLDDESFNVIGVMPEHFSFPNRETQFWIPIRFSAEDFEDRANRYLYCIAKLKDGVSIEQARADMATVGQNLEKQYPKENYRTEVTVLPLRSGIPQQSRILLAALLGASACILLIACTNLANLFMARAMARRKELAVRAALGAGREQLARQLLTESLVIGVAGAVLGIFAAHAGLPLLSRLVPSTLPIGEATVLDLRVLTLTGVLLLLTTIGFGVLPSLRISGFVDLAGLREGSRSAMGEKRERFRSALVIAEVTACVVLLIASGLLIRALLRVQAVDPGFDTENVLTLQTPPAGSKYESTAKRTEFYTQVLSQARGLPGVSQAAYISFLPMVMGGGIWPVENAGSPPADPNESWTASLRFVTPGFFESLSIPIRRGRDVSESDTADSQFVAVVSQSFIDRYWPEQQDPIGRTFHIAFQDRVVVGVVGNVRVRGLERESEPQVYLPYRQQVPDGALFFYSPKALVIKSTTDATAIVPNVRRIIQNADPDMPVADVRMLEDVVHADTAPRLTQIRVVGAFAALSLLLAGIGIHGLLAFAVSERTSEIGLRMALGATTKGILGMVVRKAVRIAAIGGTIGLILAYGAGQTIEAVLAGIHPGDPVTFLAAVMLAFLATISGSLIPAWRAVRIDPAAVMRTE